MAYSSVQWGTYFGFTLAEMQAEQARAKAVVAAVTHGPQNIVNASVNGKSFGYGPNGTWTVTEWQAEIQDALSQVSDAVFQLPSYTVGVVI